MVPKNSVAPTRRGSSRAARLAALTPKTIPASRAVSAKPICVLTAMRATISTAISTAISATSTSATRQREVSRITA